MIEVRSDSLLPMCWPLGGSDRVSPRLEYLAVTGTLELVFECYVCGSGIGCNVLALWVVKLHLGVCWMTEICVLGIFTRASLSWHCVAWRHATCSLLSCIIILYFIDWWLLCVETVLLNITVNNVLCGWGWDLCILLFVCGCLGGVFWRSAAVVLTVLLDGRDFFVWKYFAAP